MPFWRLRFDCTDCPVLRQQLADALNELMSVQEQLQNVKRERQTYSDSLKSIQADVRNSNEKLLQNSQLITELKDKVALYQEANQIMFEKCAQVNDLEGEVRTLREKVQQEHQEPSGGPPPETRPSEQYATESPYRTNSATRLENPEDMKRLSTREDALGELSKHLQELPQYLKQSNFLTTSSSLTIRSKQIPDTPTHTESINN